MTLASDGATDGLWQARAPIISDCWNVYSPSSCLSSQPCSPGPTGGLGGHAEKSLSELTTLPSTSQESLYTCKRIRLQTDTGPCASAQEYNLIEATQATSLQLACCVTPAPHSCGLEPFLQPSSGLANFGSQLSSVYIGGSVTAPAHQVAQPVVGSSVPDICINHKLLPCCGVSAVAGRAASFVAWQPLLQHQPQHPPQPQPPSKQQQSIQPFQQHPLQHLQQLQQQLAQLVAGQSALACSAGLMTSVPLSMPLGDVRSSSQPTAPALSSVTSRQGRAPPADCGASQVGSGAFGLPFIFTGVGPAQPPQPAVAPVEVSLPSLSSGFLAAPLDSASAVLRVAGDLRRSAVNAAGLSAAFGALSAAAGGALLDQFALAPQLGLQQPSLPASQLETPCFGCAPEHGGGTALRAADTRVGAHGSQPQLLPLQPQLQQQQQQQLLQPPQRQPLKVRHAHPRRQRPPSPSPPVSPSSPPHSAPLGPDEWIMHVIKVLGMSEPDTARLALHCWRRVSELPQLHHAVRLWSTAIAGRNLYATACLWVSIKLEEKRRAAPGGVVLAHLASVTPAALCSAELAVMNWLEWRPYDGYRLDESHLLVYM